MKKRSCQRFTIPGATLSYKKKKLFFFDKEYSTDSFPVINLSKGANILWQTGAKPTKFVPEFEDYVYISVVGVYKNKPALAYTINPNLINLNGVEEY